MNDRDRKQTDINNSSSWEQLQNKQNINVPFLILLLITAWFVIGELFFITVAIREAIKGSSTTSFAVIFIILLSPLAIGFTITSLLLFRSLRAKGYVLRKTIKFALLIVLVVSVISGAWRIINRMY